MTTIVDGDGKQIVVGTRVTVYGDVPGNVARVVEVTDPDGDVDDYGRSIAIPPYVAVAWPDGETDRFSTSWSAAWWDEDAPYECDDLVVVAEAKEER